MHYWRWHERPKRMIWLLDTPPIYMCQAYYLDVVNVRFRLTDCECKNSKYFYLKTGPRFYIASNLYLPSGTCLKQEVMLKSVIFVWQVVSHITSAIKNTFTSIDRSQNIIILFIKQYKIFKIDFHKIYFLLAFLWRTF